MIGTSVPSPVLVVLESPYAGDVVRNQAYAIKAMRDCFRRGEAPFASHLLYTEALIDEDPIQRQLSIDSGLAWACHASKSVVYIDYGISRGMAYGIQHAKACDRMIMYRRLYPVPQQSSTMEDLVPQGVVPGDLIPGTDLSRSTVDRTLILPFDPSFDPLDPETF